MDCIEFNQGVEISEYLSKEGHYLIEIPKYNNQLVINTAVYNLLNIIIENQLISIHELCKNYLKIYNEEIAEEDALHSIKLLLKGGVLSSPGFEPQKRKNNYLKFRFVLIAKKTVITLASFFTFLYHKLFKWAFLISLPFVCFGAYYIAFNKSFIPESKLSYGVYLSLILISILFHELGHASALLKYKQKPGEIGIGLYLYIIPVFYTSLSNAWRLNTRQRLIVDFGGVYFQYITVIFFLIGSVFFPELHFVPFSILIIILYQFNPFIRLDGYWILSDWLKQDQLLISAQKLLDIFFLDLIKGNPIQLEKKQIPLFIYAIINKTYILFIYLTFFLIQPEMFFDFPDKISKLVHLDPFFSSISLGLLFNAFFPVMILLFMVVMIIKNFSYFKKIYQKTSNIN